MHYMSSVRGPKRAKTSADRENTEVIDFFAPPRDDFLLGGKPAYMSEG
jgi:hypothetical protein